MGLIYRTSSIANVGPSSIKNAGLTYEEGDGNIAYLLTNLSGSSVSIIGNTTVSGSMQIDGNIQIEGNVFMPQLTDASQNNIVTFDTASGRFYYTASSAIVSNNSQLAQTASFVTASGVYGPYGSNSVLSSSFAISASWSPAPNLSGYVTTQSFNSFTSSYNTGSFTGSFTGQFLGTSSFALSASYVPSLQQVTDTGNITNKDITVSNSATNASITATSTAGDGTARIGFSNTWKGHLLLNNGTYSGIVRANDLTTSRTYQLPNQSGTIALVSDTGSLIATASSAGNTITFTKGDGSTFPITVNTGSIDLSVYTTTSSFNSFTSSYNTGSFTGSFTGQLIGTSSWANNALTSSFITASNVWGPYNQNSVISASHAVSASWAPPINLSGYTTTGSFNSFTSSYKSDSASFDSRISSITFDTSSLPTPAITVNAATTGVLPGTALYNNGVSGVGAFISSSANIALGAIDGITMLPGDRLLVKNQVAQLQNGVYDVIATGSASSRYILSRSIDSDETVELDSQIVIPSFGTTNAGGIFAQNTNNPIVGTNNIVYVRQTSTLVTQNTTGTQAIYQIPWWTGTARDLSRGSTHFRYINVTSGTTVTTSSLQLTGSFNLSGSATFTGGLTSSLFGTSSWAVSASWAPFTATNTGSLLTTASAALNVITFTKGDGSLFSITIDTGSGASGLIDTGSFITTGSSNLTQRITGSLQISGSLGVTGSISATRRVSVPSGLGGVSSNYIYTAYTNVDFSVTTNKAAFAYFRPSNTGTNTFNDGTNDYYYADINLGHTVYTGGAKAGSIKITTDQGYPTLTTYTLVSYGNNVADSNNFFQTANGRDHALTVSGSFLARDGVSLGTNISNSHIITGSIRTTGSLFVKGLTSESQANILTYDSSTGQLFFTASTAVGGTTDLSGYTTTSSFNSFTSSYNTGSFFGFFTGSLLGTASFVNLLAGPGIIINGLAITSSVRSVNGIFPTNGNIAVALSGTKTGTSASLVLSGSGNITGSITDGLVWIISNDPTPSNNGDVYIYSSGSVGAWYPVAPLDTAASDARYVKLDGANTPMAGNLNMGGFNITNAGTYFGTASWANNSLTSSFVTASNVFGPYGSNSVLSSSFAISASWAPFTATNTSSLLTTASVSLNTITFTKGDGSTFPITVNTGSGGGSGLSGGTQYYVPVWTGATTLGTSSLYESGSVLTIISGSNQTGLRLDYKNNTYAIGNNLFSGSPTRLYLDSQLGDFWIEHLGNRIIQSYLNTKRVVLGDIDNTATYTLFDIDDSAGTIKTSYQGNDTGLKLDFANNQYFLGVPDIGVSVNLNNERFYFGDYAYAGSTGTYFSVDSGLQLITTHTLGADRGLKLDFANQIYYLGDYNSSYNGTNIQINDITNTISISGSTILSGSLFVNNLTTGSTSNVLTYDTTTGQVFITASSAIGGTTVNTGSFLTTGSLSTTQQLSGSLNVTGSLNFFSGSTNAAKIENGWVVLTYVSTSLDFANDTAAAAGGVPLGGLYRNGNAISIRIA